MQPPPTTAPYDALEARAGRAASIVGAGHSWGLQSSFYPQVGQPLQPGRHVPVRFTQELHQGALVSAGGHEANKARW